MKLSNSQAGGMGAPTGGAGATGAPCEGNPNPAPTPAKNPDWVDKDYKKKKRKKIKSILDLYM